VFVVHDINLDTSEGGHCQRKSAPARTDVVYVVPCAVQLDNGSVTYQPWFARSSVLNANQSTTAVSYINLASCLRLII
jgi:hypothetical protein